MMNTRIRYMMLIALVLCLCGCGEDEDMDEVGLSNENIVNIGDETEVWEEDTQTYPKIAYIDDVSYYGTDKICETVPRKSPDGFIETFVPAQVMPDSHNSANFGADQDKLEYMFLDDNQLIIHIGEAWYYFEQG